MFPSWAVFILLCETWFRVNGVRSVLIIILVTLFEVLFTSLRTGSCSVSGHVLRGASRLHGRDVIAKNW
jgi:hypothetical protein